MTSAVNEWPPARCVLRSLQQQHHHSSSTTTAAAPPQQQQQQQHHSSSTTTTAAAAPLQQQQHHYNSSKRHDLVLQLLGTWAPAAAEVNATHLPRPHASGLGASMPNSTIHSQGHIRHCWCTAVKRTTPVLKCRYTTLHARYGQNMPHSSSGRKLECKQHGAAGNALVLPRRYASTGPVCGPVAASVADKPASKTTAEQVENACDEQFYQPGPNVYVNTPHTSTMRL
jgi:hypothetical protein